MIIAVIHNQAYSYDSSLPIYSLLTCPVIIQFLSVFYIFKNNIENESAAGPGLHGVILRRCKAQLRPHILYLP